MNNNINSLRKAYAQSPDNVVLLILLLQMLYENKQIDEASQYLQNLTVELIELEDRLLAGNIALAANMPDLTIKYCSGNTAEELIIKARAYLVLSDPEKGLNAYNQAINANAALEDLELKSAFNAITVDFKKKSGAKVIEFQLITNSNPQIQKNQDDEDDLISSIRPIQSNISFKDVGGLHEVKKQIHRKIILPFQKPSLFKRFKKKSGGGVLLYGPPGCGKTLLARATAGECNASFYNIVISDILDMWLGESEKKLHAIFEQARRTAPSILFFDEIEALAGKRSSQTTSAGSKLVSQFLSELDGFSQNNQELLVLGATNVPWSIDNAFRRPGRFDQMQFISPPDKEARQAILQILLAERPLEKDINLEYLAKVTTGFSGADLSHLVEIACDIAIEDSIDEGVEKLLSMSFLKEALKEVKPTTQEWLTTARNFARYANESGQYDDILNFLGQYGK